MIFSPKVSPKFLCTHSSLFCSCVAEEENFSSSLFLSVHYFTHIFLQIHSTFSHPIQSTTHPSSLPFHSFFDPLFLHANSLFWVSFIFRISLSPHCDYLLIPNWCLVAEKLQEKKNHSFSVYWWSSVHSENFSLLCVESSTSDCMTHFWIFFVFVVLR